MEAHSRVTFEMRSIHLVRFVEFFLLRWLAPMPLSTRSRISPISPSVPCSFVRVLPTFLLTPKAANNKNILETTESDAHLKQRLYAFRIKRTPKIFTFYNLHLIKLLSNNAQNNAKLGNFQEDPKNCENDSFNRSRTCLLRSLLSCFTGHSGFPNNIASFTIRNASSVCASTLFVV